MYRNAIAARGGRYPQASYSLGVALEDLQRPAEAGAAYRDAIASSGKTYAPAYFRLGLITANGDDFATAVTLFREALSRWPGKFPAAHNNLGVALARTGQLREAEREFVIASSQGNSSEARHNLELCRSLLKARGRIQVASLLLITGNDLTN